MDISSGSLSLIAYLNLSKGMVAFVLKFATIPLACTPASVLELPITSTTSPTASYIAFSISSCIVFSRVGRLNAD